MLYHRILSLISEINMFLKIFERRGFITRIFDNVFIIEQFCYNLSLSKYRLLLKYHAFCFESYGPPQQQEVAFLK